MQDLVTQLATVSGIGYVCVAVLRLYSISPALLIVPIVLVLIIVMGMFYTASHSHTSDLLSSSDLVQSVLPQSDSDHRDDALHVVMRESLRNEEGSDDGDDGYDYEIEIASDFFDISSMSSADHDDDDDDDDEDDDDDDDDDEPGQEHEDGDDEHDDHDDDNTRDDDDNDDVDSVPRFVDDVEQQYDHQDDSDDNDANSIVIWRKYLQQTYGDDHANDYDSEVSSLHYNVHHMDALDDIV